jgi:serine/threonine-protein kinase
VSSENDKDLLESRLRQAQAELERRLHAGDECRAEEFFANCPVLAEDVNCALDLIYTEFATRDELGQRPNREEYYRRFPQWRTDLEALLVLHQEMQEPAAVRVLRITDPHGTSEQYQILKQLSKSLNGTVDKARHVRLKHLVAVKTFAGGDLAEATRFLTGAREQKRLQHPHILPVHDVGESEEGLPCFAMEFAEGGNLDQRIAGKAQPPEEAARLVRTLAEAISYAHQKQVVHRDLKPANVLLAADGTPRITDFGLARRLDAPSGQSKTGEILGTPQYMAPEQAAGRTHEVGPLSDVYGLGAILYELLTGQPPFQGATVVQTIQQVIARVPRRPRRLVRGVQPGLESICLKCLEKKPRRRYHSAQELADDLGRWLDGKRPQAHSRGARTSRFLRRHLLLCSAAVFFGAGLMIALLALAAYLMDPERIPEAIEDDLAAGKTAFLIGEKGPPRYKRWKTSEESQKDQFAPDGSFQITSRGLARIELVRSTRQSRYRFSAWVRHDERFAGTGDMGIYFEITGGDWSYCTLACDGFTDWRRRYPNGNPVPLKVRPQVGSGSKSGYATAGSPAYVPVARGAPPDWLNLAVEVAPEKVRFTVWRHGQPQGKPVEVPREKIDHARNILSRPLPGASREIDPAFASPGGLGLFLDSGSASFKNVVVTPNP